MRVLIISLLFSIISAAHVDVKIFDIGRLFFANNQRIEINSDNSLNLVSLDNKIIDSHKIEGEIIHWFHLDETKFNIQTSIYSYVLAVESDKILIKGKSQNPEGFDKLDGHFYLKWDEKEITFTEKAGSVSITFKSPKFNQPKTFGSYNPPMKIKDKSNVNQALYDFKNSTIYFNLKNQRSIVFVNTQTGFMGNLLLRESSDMKEVKSAHWYTDITTSAAYLLVTSSKSKNKLFNFQNGVPKQPDGKKMGRMIIYNSFSTFEELGLFIGTVNRTPLYIQDQTLFFKGDYNVAIKDL
jgi:hypothetical protein